jgi:hypothetical protein
LLSKAVAFFAAFNGIFFEYLVVEHSGQPISQDFGVCKTNRAKYVNPESYAKNIALFFQAVPIAWKSSSPIAYCITYHATGPPHVTAYHAAYLRSASYGVPRLWNSESPADMLAKAALQGVS